MQREPQLGDRVRIRSRQELAHCTNINSVMPSYGGMESVITSVRRIPEQDRPIWRNTQFMCQLADGGYWNWHEDSFILLDDEPGETFRC